MFVWVMFTLCDKLLSRAPIFLEGTVYTTHRKEREVGIHRRWKFYLAVNERKQ